MRIVFGRKLTIACTWRQIFHVFHNTTAASAEAAPFKAGTNWSSEAGTTPFFGLNMSQTIKQLSDTDLPDIDLLAATAFDLQELLAKKIVSSVQLVHLYFGQIERHNHKGAQIGAIISTAPREQVLEIAANLDLERDISGPRGPFHGIPVIVKVG
jgi:hypothetical protein